MSYDQAGEERTVAAMATLHSNFLRKQCAFLHKPLQSIGGLGCRTFGEDRRGISGGAGNFSLPAMPWSDWEIPSTDIQICRRPNGSDWELGSGSFGKVDSLSGSNPPCHLCFHVHESPQNSSSYYGYLGDANKDYIKIIRGSYGCY